MLNDAITALTEKYHDIGHSNPAVDHMMDMGGGFGHRVEFGHDLDGFLRAYNLDGLHGMEAWADHILKDFTSPHGIPLPFSEALVHLTPLDIQDGVEWLSVNAADFLEVGTEAIVVQHLEKKFHENPQARRAYHTALAVGLGLGFIDDNPLLVAFSGGKWLLNAKGNLAEMNPELNARIDGFAETALAKVQTVSYWAMGGDVAAHLLHVADILPTLEHATDGIPVLHYAGEFGGGLADMVDGFATLGIALAARRAVRSLFGLLNGVKEREASRLAEQARPIVVLSDMLASGATAAQLVGTVSEMKTLPSPRTS